MTWRTPGGSERSYDLWRELQASAGEEVTQTVDVIPSTYRAGVVGLPGTGKSTALQILSLEHGIASVGTTAFHQPDSRLAMHIHRLFVEGDLRVALTCQIEALWARVRLLRTASPHTVVDEPLEAVLAHTLALWRVGWLDTDEAYSWLLSYEVGRRLVPSAKSLVMFTCDRDELSRRWANRGRRRDLSVSDRYLDEFDLALRFLLHAGSVGGPSVHRLDTSGVPPDHVASMLVSVLNDQACFD